MEQLKTNYRFDGIISILRIFKKTAHFNTILILQIIQQIMRSINSISAHLSLLPKNLIKFSPQQYKGSGD